MSLIERDHELAQLADLVQDARSGAGSLVLVSGEAGAGKSALVAAFAAGLADTSTRVVAGACDGVSVPRPLGPVIEIAAQLEVDVTLPRDELFAAVLAALTQWPTVVLLEDVHWADDATADFLLYVGRRVDALPALVVATYRNDEDAGDGGLSRLAGELLRLGTVRRVMVPALSPAGVARLVGDADLDPAEVYRRTSGNAFFVTELVAAGPSGSATIREVVLGRAARLSARGRRVLDVASQLGLRCSLAVLAEVCGADRDGIDDCVETGMLVASGDELGFRHELTRAVIAEEIPPVRRAGLNGAALRVLDGRPGVDVARLATHAALANEAEAAYRYGLIAGQAAARLGSHGEAVRHLRTATRFASSQPLVDRARLLDELAAQCMMTDQLVEAAAAAEESIRLWSEVDDPIRLGAAYRAMAHISWYLGQGEAARTHGAQAVATLQPHGPTVELARALTQAATFQMVAGNNAEALAIGQPALQMAEQLGDAYATADVLNTVGCARLDAEPAEGINDLERSLQVAREHNLGHLAGRAYANLASCLAEQHAFERCDAVLAEGLRYTEDRELTIRVVCLTGILADSELVRGRWDDALTDALGVLERSANVSIGQVPALTVIGTIKMRRGEDNADSYLRDALRRAEDIAEIQRIAPLALALAEGCWLRDDPAGVRTWLEAGRAADGAPDLFTEGQLRSWAGRLGAPGSAPAGTPKALALEIEGRWGEAAEAWRAWGRPYETALALIEVGTPAALTEAHQILDQLGARPALALVAGKLRGLGERVPRGVRASTRANPAGLTARELEVLQLIAEGLTNAAIAARLYISEKTAQHHVSRILTKLDVPSRHEAAQLAREMGAVEVGRATG